MNKIFHTLLAITIVCFSHSMHGMEEIDHTNRLINFLFDAIEHNDIKAVDIMLNADTNVALLLATHNKNMDGATPLMIASCSGHAKVVKRLLSAGADIFQKDNIDCTALHYASVYGKLEVIQILLNAGANINATDKYGKTPLFIAALFYARCGDIKMAELLINAQADVNQATKYGQTPLSQENHVVLAQLLLENGADIHRESNNGKTALQMAYKEGHTDIEKQLKPVDYNDDISIKSTSKKFNKK
jgi:ankyrin repeat protein